LSGAQPQALAALLRALRPRLNPGQYIFCSFPDVDYGALAALHPVAAFLEDEGLTLVLPLEAALIEDLTYEGVFSWITLGVESSLMAVGLTAAVAGALAAAGISANVIAAAHHDHIFVPDADRGRAMAVLQGLAQGAV
jgi:uncharacterized protein